MFLERRFAIIVNIAQRNIIEMAEGPSEEYRYMTEKLYNISDAVKETGYSDQYLRQLCRARKIPHMRRRGRIFFTAEDLASITAGERVAPVVPVVEIEIEKPAAEDKK